jgi:uncharacterized repeat protein (TIGR01451 family)
MTAERPIKTIIGLEAQAAQRAIKGVIALALVAGLAAAAVVVCPAGDLRAGELVKNGGFETGSFSGGWVDGAGQLQSGQTDPRWADHMVVLDLPFAGNYSALIGFKYAQIRGNRFGYIYQDVAIPTNISRATLFFKFRQQGYDGLNYDPFRMQIRNTANAVLATVVEYSFAESNHLFKDSGWLDDDGVAPVGYSMTSYAGQTVQLYFYQENSFNNFYETWAYVDDVSLVYKRWVDLAVDGDGDDVFGALGSGAGGYSVKSAEQGETVSYIADIENEGLDSDSYHITATPPSGWSVTVRYDGATYGFPWNTPVLAAGSKIQVEVIVSVPPGAPVAGYSTIVDAVSTNFANRYDSARLGTNVVPAEFQPDLVIDSNGFGAIDPEGGGGISYRETPLNAQVSYTVDLYNAGVRADSFLVRFSGVPPLSAEIIEGGRTHSGAFRTGPVAPEELFRCTLRVTVPASLLGGDYVNLIHAVSLGDTVRKDGVRAITRVLAPKLDVVICGSGDGIIDPTGAGRGGSISVAGTPGTTVYFPFTVRNEGAVVDSFAISWVWPGSGWTAQVLDGATLHPLPWTTPRFAPYSERGYVFAITIPSNASLDTYTSIYNFVSSVSASVRESVGASITVTTGNEIDLVIDGNGNNVYGYLGTALGGSSVLTARPGETLNFTIQLENESGENLSDIRWTTPAGWYVAIGDSTSTMRRIVAGTYTMEVRVPASCHGGTFDIVVDGWKTNKHYFVDSVRGRVVVTPPAVVDVLIDGSGDEVFGAIGSGEGGASSQSTTAGRTLRFTVELENQGSATESYRVTWNAVSGWLATLQGSASPYTTAPVAPGASILLTFQVSIPYSAAAATRDYIVDVVSTLDANNVESVRATVEVNPPPRADLMINGNGAFQSAPPGSGAGGMAVVFGSPGAMVTATLELVNRGGFPDSFRVSWSPPDGWPSGSVVISDGGGDHASPYLVGVIDPGDARVFTVKVLVPAAAAMRTRIIIDGVALSRDLEDSITLEIGTGSFVAGIVFNDADHDGIHDAGEEGWTGVTVTISDPGGTLQRETDGSSAYQFEVVSGLPRTLIELTPAGMVSLSPDTVSLGPTAPGETLRVDFADVRLPAIAPPNDLSGPSGAFLDAPHVVIAGTRGQATLTASLPSGWLEIFYRDNDADGRLGPSDSLLRPSDLALDPEAPGFNLVPVIVRVFVPPQVPPGTSAALTLTLRQVLSGTTISVETAVTDRLLVLGRASGLLSLLKDVDRPEARPGDVMTYTITFSNPGVEAVKEIEIIDPVSPSVAIVRDAFGPGRDIEWVRDGVSVYLTADPGDSDEAMLEMPDGLLHVVLSRQAPYVLEGGASGRIVYRVRIR